MTRQTGPVIPGYVQVGHLGSGGFADVFQYRHDSGASYAVKAWRGEVTAAAREQLRTEARALGRLAELGHHPNVVTTYPTSLAEGLPYLIMELCPGGSLAGKGQMPIAEVLRIGIQMCGALHTAHLHDVLHRDLKPGNILLARDGTAKLSDFGIAALTAHRHGVATDMLTLHYSAPEIDVNGTASRYSDTYALAATLYELLAGRPPFKVNGGDNGTAAVEARKLNNEIPPISRSDVPAELQRLLRVAMRRDVGDRAASIASAEAFGKELIQLAAVRKDEPTGLIIFQPTGRSVDYPDATMPRKTAESGGPAESRRPVSVGRMAEPPDPAASPRWPSPQTPADRTELRAPSGGRPAVSEADSKIPRGRIALVSAAVVILIGTVVGVALGVGSGGDTQPSAVPTVVNRPPDDSFLDTVPTPRVTAHRLAGGAVRFTWTYSPVAPGDSFMITRTDVTVPAAISLTDPDWVAKVSASALPCVEVIVVRRNGLGSAIAGRACASPAHS